MGIYAAKPAFQRSLKAMEDYLVIRRVHPDVLTVSALVLSLAGGAVLFLAGAAPRWLLLAVPIIALARTTLNALDGLVARRTGLARPWGAVLNEIGDRLADIALFGGLALAPYTEHHLGSATLAAILFSSYLGVLSKAVGGPREYSGIMAKADRMLALSVAAVAALALDDRSVFNYLLALVLGGAILTSIQRLVKIHGYLHRQPDA